MGICILLPTQFFVLKNCQARVLLNICLNIEIFIVAQGTPFDN